MTAGRPFAAAVLAAALALTQASPVGAQASAPGASDWRTPDPQNVLVIDTNKGRIIVEMTPEVAPNHAQRLRELTRAGLYDGRAFFRVIDNFMAQTGDPQDTGEGGSDKPDLVAEFTFRRGADSPFVPVAKPTGGETGFIGPLPVMSQNSAMMVMTADAKVSAWGLFCPGVLGMARAGDPDSANSQFFLMREAYPSLDKRYTAFGRVLSGLQVVRSIKIGEPVEPPQDRMTKVRLLADIPAAERPSVRVVDAKSPWFTAEVERVRAAKGADFSVCDIDFPAEVK